MKVRRGIIAILLITLVLSSSLTVLADDIKKVEKHTVQEYGGILNKVRGKSIEYIKTTLEGHDATIFTITKGKYKPINLVEFLQHIGSPNYTVVSQEKALYIQEDLNGKHLLYINENKTSMEPIVLMMEDGHKVFIRFSKEFIENNNIPLSEGHELFEEGWDIKEIKENDSTVKYVDFTGNRMVTVETDKLKVMDIGDNGFGEGVIYLTTRGNGKGDYSGGGTIDFNNPIKINPKDNPSTLYRPPTGGGTPDNPKDKIGDDIFGVPDKPGYTGNLNPPTKPLGGRDNITEDIWGNTNNKGDLEGEVDNTQGKDDKFSLGGLHQNSTRQEIMDSNLTLNEFTDLYTKALMNQWDNAGTIHVLYNEALENATAEDKEDTVNRPPVNKGEVTIPGDNNTEDDTRRPYKDPGYLEGMWGSEDGSEEMVDCYAIETNEVDIAECQSRTKGGMSLEEYFKLYKRDGLDENGRPIKPGFINPGDYTAEDLENMTDEEFDKLFGSSTSGGNYMPPSSSGGGGSSPNYTIEDILSGNIGSSHTERNEKYQVEFGKMETDKILTDMAEMSDEMLLLTAYQELDFNVYNEKMEKINPHYIPVIEPQMKKVNFISYDSQLDKSTLLLKFIAFFALLIVITLGAIVKSRDIRDTKKREKFKEGLKFREEEIQFSNFLDDKSLEVE